MPAVCDDSRRFLRDGLLEGLMLFPVSSDLSEETLRAWEEYTGATEARIVRELIEETAQARRDIGAIAEHLRGPLANGEIPVEELRSLDHRRNPVIVPGAVVRHWRGAVFLPEERLEAALARARTPPADGPHPPDIVSLRILAASGDRLMLLVRMARREVVTVLYDMVHELKFRRFGPHLASSRTVATTIAEIGAAPRRRGQPERRSRGLLWRSHAYWRFEALRTGLLAQHEVLTLSREIPWALRSMAGPIVDREARDFVGRTLAHLRWESQLSAGRF
jgi:hypothetical protein